MICVAIDGAGNVVEDTVSTAPECAEFTLLAASEFSTMTYWADLAIALHPSGGAFWSIAGAMLLAFATVTALKLVLSTMKSVYYRDV